MNAHILVVEDDPTTRLSIIAILDSVGYQVMSAADGEAAIALIQQAAAEGTPYDVIITDIRMGMIDGIEVLYAARKTSRPPEVIILTGYGTMDTTIAALRAGAYDYLIKPCKPNDLLKYVSGAIERHTTELRRDDAIRMITHAVSQLQYVPPLAAAPPNGEIILPPSNRADTDQTERFIHVGALNIDTFRHIVTCNQQVIRLTPIEYDLLACLANAQGRVLGYSEIVQQTHKHDVDKNEAQGLLKTHIQNLRRKIGAEYVVSVRSTGYMLVDPYQERGGEETLYSHIVEHD